MSEKHVLSKDMFGAFKALLSTEKPKALLSKEKPKGHKRKRPDDLNHPSVLINPDDSWCHPLDENESDDDLIESINNDIDIILAFISTYLQ